jgi:hypothetical protein
VAAVFHTRCRAKTKTSNMIPVCLLRYSIDSSPRIHSDCTLRLNQDGGGELRCIWLDVQKGVEGGDYIFYSV